MTESGLINPNESQQPGHILNNTLLFAEVLRRLGLDVGTGNGTCGCTTLTGADGAAAVGGGSGFGCGAAVAEMAGTFAVENGCVFFFACGIVTL